MPKINPRTVCKMANALSGVTEKEHFGSEAFSANKRIFATVWHDKKEVNLRLSLAERDRFFELDGESFIEIDNAWGREGWTRVQLEIIDREVLEEALTSAWKQSARVVPRSRSTKKKEGTK